MSTWDTPKSQAKRGDYDPFQFYTHSRDKNKNKSSAKVTALPENIMAEIGAAIASQRYPEYRTAADFIRDACYHRAHWLAENKDDEKLDKAAAKDRAERDITMAREVMEQETKVAEDFAETIRKCIAEEVEELVKRGEAYLNTMQWNGPKEKIRNEISKYKKG